MGATTLQPYGPQRPITRRDLLPKQFAQEDTCLEEATILMTELLLVS
jgi:hypothetical protein